MPEPGDLVLTPRGQWAQKAPTHCANGHWLGPNRVLVSTSACECGRRHSTWFCRECEHVTYGPPLSAGCSLSAGIDGR